MGKNLKKEFGGEKALIQDHLKYGQLVLYTDRLVFGLIEPKVFHKIMKNIKDSLMAKLLFGMNNSDSICMKMTFHYSDP